MVECLGSCLVLNPDEVKEVKDLRGFLGHGGTWGLG